MPKVTFLIPASPSSTFFSQVAAFALAMRRLDWRCWEPSILLCLGGEPDTDAFLEWLPFLSDTATLFVPAKLAEATPWYNAQIDALYRWAPRDADVLVRMDADTLLVGDIEDLLDYVSQTGSIAGTIAHDRFPAWPGTTSREAWQRISLGLVETPLDFCYTYSLLDPKMAKDDLVTPFYLNDGAVFYPRAVFGGFAKRYLTLRPSLIERLPDPYYAGQVALALIVSNSGMRHCALPMRYNFPNDDEAARRYPEELESAKILHYLRTEAFDRRQIFRDPQAYRYFVQTQLFGVNRVFQDHIRRIFGEEYPFTQKSGRGGVNVDCRGMCPPSELLSAATYRGLVDAHQRSVAAALEQVEAAIGVLGGISSFDRAASSDTSAALDWARQFEASGRVALEPLMRCKRTLVQSLGVERGFALYRECLALPHSDRIRRLALASQHEFASRSGEAFVETTAGGEPYTIAPPTVIGEAVRRPLEHVSRALYVACLRDVRVRGRSAVIEADGCALLDFQGSERQLFDCDLDIDPAIFHAEQETAWIMAPDDQDSGVEIEEAFALVGPHSGAFGDWMGDYLPRYLTADMSGVLPAVPVLVDALLPPTIRESLELIVRPGVRVLELSPYACMRVRRLWCAPSLHYAPSRERMDARFRFDYISPPPERLAAVGRELSRRVSNSGNGTARERIYLARKPRGWRKLVNYAEIEDTVRRFGFFIIYPEEMSFTAQAALMRGARFVIAPEGSALFLAYFARPGTRLCILNHSLIEASIGYNGIFDGVEITILTGPILRHDPDFPHRADYTIDAAALEAFLAGWH